MPLRSTGCYQCRRRKIRCDGTRPKCQRCATHGVECPGYQTSPGQVEFRDETKLAAHRTSLSGDRGIRKRTPSNQGRNRLSGSEGSSRISSPATSGDATTPTNSLFVLRSPGANRIQLYNSFINIFIPQNILPKERGTPVDLAHFGFLRQLASNPSSHSALSSGMNALSLVSLGSLYRDKQLLRKAVEEHTHGLNRLAVALSQPGGIDDDDVLAAVMVLILCEFYEEIHQEGQGWLYHQHGLQQLIAARGPQSMSKESSTLLLMNAKNLSFTNSMLSRKTDFYDSPDWRQVSTDPLSLVDTGGLELPALLERHDNLDLANEHALQDIDRLLADCIELERKLTSYLSDATRDSTMTDGRPFCLEDIEKFPAFAKLVSNRTMAEAYRFPSFTSAFLHESYWLRMSFLQSTIKSLQVSRKERWPHHINEAADRKPSVCEDDLLHYVIDLCRCVPYFTEPSNGYIGHICCFFPLLMASNYFKQHEHREWLEWTHTVRSSIFNRGLSLPAMENVERSSAIEALMSHAPPAAAAG